MTRRAIEDNQAGSRARIDPREASGRLAAYDYLRAFAVVLVLFHHAVLAYTLSASINVENPIATATPVVNEGRWPLFDLIVMYNETFFMPLLFFVSGMFAWPSLARKGVRKYLGGRLTRLGLPFAIGVVFLIPLAYYPAQLQAGWISGADTSYGAFWLEMIRSCFKTAGPLWFLWLLLAFNCLAALMYRTAPALGVMLRKRSASLFSSQGAFFGALLGISLAAYLPLAISVGPLTWIGIGPFHAQVSRILLYLVYYLAGTAIGAYGIERTMFRPDSALARRAWRWLGLNLISFAAFAILVVVVNATARTIFSEILFVLCCGTAVFGISGLFLRYVQRRRAILDSLRENSYGIYVLHYVFVTWLQICLLRSALAPGVKGMLVFGGTLLFSWGTAAAIRRLPAVAKVL